MNQGKYIFSQLMEFLPRRTFDGIVKSHEGNKYIRSFTCWNQMLCMVFGQLTSRDSMRDLMLSLEAHQPKYYHLGFGPSISHPEDAPKHSAGHRDLACGHACRKFLAVELFSQTCDFRAPDAQRGQDEAPSPVRQFL